MSVILSTNKMLREYSDPQIAIRLIRQIEKLEGITKEQKDLLLLMEGVFESAKDMLHSEVIEAKFRGIFGD